MTQSLPATVLSRLAGEHWARAVMRRTTGPHGRLQAGSTRCHLQSVTAAFIVVVIVTVSEMLGQVAGVRTRVSAHVRAHTSGVSVIALEEELQ